MEVFMFVVVIGLLCIGPATVYYYSDKVTKWVAGHVKGVGYGSHS
jgi:hypothetical protein